jgi:hypothetical protein
MPGSFAEFEQWRTDPRRRWRAIYDLNAKIWAWLQHIERQPQAGDPGQLIHGMCDSTICVHLLKSLPPSNI